jgi:hypothetical protein
MVVKLCLITRGLPHIVIPLLLPITMNLPLTKAALLQLLPAKVRVEVPPLLLLLLLLTTDIRVRMKVGMVVMLLLLLPTKVRTRLLLLLLLLLWWAVPRRRRVRKATSGRFPRPNVAAGLPAKPAVKISP